LISLKSKRIIIGLTEKQLKELNESVKSGFYQSRTEAVRDAVRQFLENRKSKKGFSMASLLLIFAIVSILVPLATYYGSSIVGMFVGPGVEKSGVYLDVINFDLNGSKEYEWVLNDTCSLETCSIDSIKISGSIIANASGDVKVYIENSGKRYLILNKSFQLNQTLNETQAFYFVDVCEDTCNITDVFNQSSYKLTFEISSDADLILDSIQYVWKWHEAIQENLTIITTETETITTSNMTTSSITATISNATTSKAIEKIINLQLSYINSLVLGNCTVIVTQTYENGTWKNTEYGPYSNFWTFDFAELYKITGKNEYRDLAERMYNCIIKYHKMDEKTFSISELNTQILDFYKNSNIEDYNKRLRIGDSVTGSSVLFILANYNSFNYSQPFMQKIAEHLLSNIDISKDASSYDFRTRIIYVHLKTLQARSLIYYYDLTKNTTFLVGANNILNDLFSYSFYNFSDAYMNSKYLRAICEMKQRDAGLGQQFDFIKERVLGYQYTDDGFRQDFSNDFSNPYVTYIVTMGLDSCYQFNHDARVKEKLISALKFLLKGLDEENGGIITFGYKSQRLNSDITMLLIKYKDDLNE
jgi:hypothetical protein